MTNEDLPPWNRPPAMPAWNTALADSGAASGTGSHVAIDAASEIVNSLLRLGVVTVLVGALLIPEVELHASFKVLMIALLLILIGRTTAAPLLVAFQTVLYFRPPHHDRWADLPGSCLFVITVMGLLMFLSRDRTLRWIVRQSVVDLWKTVFKNPGSAMSTTRFPASSEPPGSFVRMIVCQAICVAIAQFVLLLFPLRESGLDASGEVTSHIRTTVATLAFPLTVFVAVVVVLSELGWRRLTAPQASLYLRSTFMSLMYSDLRMVVLRRLRLRHRKK